MGFGVGGWGLGSRVWGAGCRVCLRVSTSVLLVIVILDGEITERSPPAVFPTAWSNFMVKLGGVFRASQTFRSSQPQGIPGTKTFPVHLKRFPNIRASPTTKCSILVPRKFQIRTSKNVHLRFSWHTYKTEDVYKKNTGPCFKICTTKILDGPGKQF